MPKKFGLLHILNQMKAGKNPSRIRKDLNVSRQKVDYYVGKLKKLGCIKKEGYGAWVVIKDLKEGKKVPKGSIHSKDNNLDFSKKQIRGHAFIWKISFFNQIKWEKVIKNYKKKLTFQRICRNKVFRTIFNSRKIWLTKDGMVIYEPMDFLGVSSFQTKGLAVYQMDKLIKDLLKELGERFRPYRFTTSREHYAMIKNALARQFNEKKEKLAIKNEEGSVWMWIDHSLGEHELENDEANTSRQVQGFWNDHKKHGFKVGASYVEDNFKESAKQIKETNENINKTDKNINKTTDNLDNYAKHLQSHVAAIQQLGEGVKELTKKIKEMKQ